MLIRLCLSESQAEKAATLVNQCLGDRILQDCATLCVENSQKIITLLYESWKMDGPVGILPWWYRIFYLYVASQPLLAAMLRPDLFKSMIMEPWGKAMSAFSAHEHVCPFVQQYTSTLKMMWQAANDVHSPRDQPPLVDGVSSVFSQDIFRHLGLEAETSFFGIDDIDLIGNVNWNP